MRRKSMLAGAAIFLVAVLIGAAAVLLNGLGDSNPVSAAQACNLMDTPYDTSVTASRRGIDTRIEARDSGPDKHIERTWTDSDGTLIHKIEQILKDRTFYTRKSVPGNAQVYGEWRIDGIDFPPFQPLPCEQTSDFEQDASGSPNQPHFMSEKFLSEEEGALREEFWVDSAGRPTRSRRTVFPPEHDGVSNTETIVLEFTYSDYGQPNIIEAPCASAAPDEADNPGLMRDCINLLATKDALRGTATLNWSVDTAITSWDGVKVSGTPARVTSLVLVSKGFTGTIPTDLGRLDGLEYLWLGYNQLTGEIPAALGGLASLKSLLFNRNRLTGAVPRELGGLSRLESLWLNENQLSGEIPASLGDLNNLRQLLLAGNRLSGAIPSVLGDLSNLEHLKLNYNQLTGEIPSALGRLSNLKDLLLGDNQLTGCIPPALRNVEDNDLASLGLQDCATP